MPSDPSRGQSVKLIERFTINVSPSHLPIFFCTLPRPIRVGSLPSPADLEDNGFPAQPSSPAASSSGFAEDFYRSGTDWSSLRAPPSLRPPGGPPGVKEKERGGGSLVQSSLFQAWGIEKPRREVGDSSLVQRSLFQAWGIERPRTEGLGAGDSSPSPLPFRFLVGKEAEARRNRGGGGGGQEAPRVPLLQEDSR